MWPGFSVIMQIEKGGYGMLSETLEKLRKAKGLSQEELAAKLNVVKQTISKWEQGFAVPDSETLMKAAQILETSVHDLLKELTHSGDGAQPGRYDVVIIGAGPGGIFAAYELMQKQSDLNVAIFEAGHALDKRRCPIDGDKIKPCIG